MSLVVEWDRIIKFHVSRDKLNDRQADTTLCVYVHMYIHIYMYVYIYIHIHVYTYIHMYMFNMYFMCECLRV